MDSVLFLIVYGFVFLWALAWLWAFFRTSSDVLMGMINGVFTLQGIGWSVFCALLGILPLCFAFWAWVRLQGYLPQ